MESTVDTHKIKPYKKKNNIALYILPLINLTATIYESGQ